MKRNQMSIEGSLEVREENKVNHPLIQSLKRGTLVEDALTLYRRRNPGTCL